MTDNITYYKCDVSKWSEVEAVAGRIKGEVCVQSIDMVIVDDVPRNTLDRGAYYARQ